MKNSIKQNVKKLMQLENQVRIFIFEVVSKKKMMN